jgi:hypothetical protein
LGHTTFGQTAITFEDGTALSPSTSSLGPYILGITTPLGPYLTPVEMLVSHERKFPDLFQNHAMVINHGEKRSS